MPEPSATIWAAALQLRRIDAELNGMPLYKKAGDPADLFRQVEAQYRDHRQSYLDAQEQARATLDKAQREYDSAKEVLSKLRETTPIPKQQADAYADMDKEGYAPQLMPRHDALLAGLKLKAAAGVLSET